MGTKIEAGRRRRRQRLADLRREGAQADREGQGGRGVRLLHVGFAQGGAAGIREARRACCTTRRTTKGSSSRPTSCTRPRRRRSPSSPPWTGCTRTRARRFYMIGSDYIWPRTTIKIAKAVWRRSAASCVGRRLLPARPHRVLVRQSTRSRRAKPDVILQLRGGRQQRCLLQAANGGRHHGQESDPALARGVGRGSIRHRRGEHLSAHSPCMGYFQSLKNPANEKFVKAFKAKYGANRVVGDTLDCGYISVYLWKMAAEKAKSFEVREGRRRFVAIWQSTHPKARSISTRTNHHLWKHARIGAFQPGRPGQHDLRVAADRAEPVPEAVIVGPARAGAGARPRQPACRGTVAPIAVSG